MILLYFGQLESSLSYSTPGSHSMIFYNSTGNSLIQTLHAHNDGRGDVNKMCTMIDVYTGDRVDKLDANTWRKIWILKAR